MKDASNLLDLPIPTQPGRPSQWGRLYGSALSLAIAELSARHAGPICILAPNAAVADRIELESGFFRGDRSVRHFPDYETLPYEFISAPQELIAERLHIMHDLASGHTDTLILTVETLLNRLPPVEFIQSRSLSLAVGDSFERDAMAARLTDRGYLRVERVGDPGEFAVRGSIIDIFPTGSREPIRIDLFDNEVENLRMFDPRSQLSTRRVDRIDILPAREFPFDAEAIREFRRRFREAFVVEPGRASVYRDISEAVLPAGIEYYLPLFFEGTCCLLDYLPAATLLVDIDGALAELDNGWKLIETRHDQLSGDHEHPLLPPEKAFFSPSQLLERIRARPALQLRSVELDATEADTFNAPVGHPLAGGIALDSDQLGRWLNSTAAPRTLLACSSRGRRELLTQMLTARGHEPKPINGWQEFLSSSANLAVGVAELEQGMLLQEHGLRVVTAEQLGLEKPRQRAKRRRPARDPDTIISELTDLRVGAPVVHEEYGVGRYLGLANLEVDEIRTEFLLLEYADGDKLYVPVQSLHLVSRYTGAAPEHAPLHRLGSDQWNNAKRKAAKHARDVAAELLHLYAKRASRSGTAMRGDQSSYEQFAAQFPFEETEDQAKAIDDVLNDLIAGKPMDRVICGDVGFGKTEVALRSAMVVAEAGYQVAVLVPTTLLAQQHFRTFSDRFADWPINVQLLSRFSNSADSKAAIAGLADGSVDVVIGTHKLLQRGLGFKRLGLIVVDEEHRFGVKHKEQLKRMRADVHMLTMTATPIPRTLNMTLGGLKDLSIIATPPADRLSVKTFVGEWKDLQVREAILREIRRGGQVYFVHNRVQSIESTATKLRLLVPEAQFRVAHGQMPEAELEAIMIDFYHRRFNVLVCTTIIESGIDIPTANTIVIDRADRLGLAQLHQLRGRVGRSHHQAYAYLMAPPLRTLTAEAQKRLEAIEALEQLGSGFTLATHDLEIRGAGELLGEGQSGQIHAIGFSLYNDLLARAVRELRAGREPDLDDPFVHGAEVESGLVALIPEDYMPDVHMRLVHYKRIASAPTREDLESLQVELIDRFGLLPDATKNLFAITSLKQLAQTIGVQRLRFGDNGGFVEFGQNVDIDPAALVRLVADGTKRYRMDGPFKLRFRWESLDQQQQLRWAAALLEELGASAPRQNSRPEPLERYTAVS